MSQLGVYFGPKIITIVDSNNRKTSNIAELPQTVMAGADLDEKVPIDIRMTETVGFFKSEFKKNNITSKDVTLCLPGQDVFIRTFEMPAMEPDELRGAINFEVEKYIPFKSENLVSDYQIHYEKQSRTNLVLFFGIKKEILDRYMALAIPLGLKVNAVEYAGFSILRGVQAAGGNLKGVTAVLSADFTNDDEINFSVLENDFPLFSRDITLLSAEGRAAQDIAIPGSVPAPEIGTRDNLEKLKTEIRVSLDYYERKYPTKIIKKMALVSKPDCRPDIEAFAKEIGFEFQFVDLRKNIGGAFPYNLGVIKAYSASISRDVKVPLKLNLISAKEKVRQAAKDRPSSFQGVKPTASVLEGVSLDPRFVIAGLLICGAAFGAGLYQSLPVQQEIQKVISERPKVENIDINAAVPDLEGKRQELNKKLDTLQSLVKKQLFVTNPLNVIPAALPKGVWLSNFQYAQRTDTLDQGTLMVDGIAYLGDNTKEFDAVYEFVAKLSQNPEFARYFTSVSVASITRSTMYTLPVTTFSLLCMTAEVKN
jgi:hypothetical protein